MGPARAVPLLLLVLGLVVSGCDDTPSPEASLRAFIAAASAGDHDTAWKALSAETREAADALVVAVRPGLLAAGEVPPADGKALIFGSGLEMIREVEAISELSRTKARARLKITAPDESSVELEMRLEEGRWRLHLPLDGAPAT